MKIPVGRGSLVVTSISGPNPVLKSLADQSLQRGVHFVVIGDSKSPPDFELPGCDFYPIERQKKLPFSYAKLCHEKSYARKNIGYLLSIARGSKFIVETDDDNYPNPGFWQDRCAIIEGSPVSRRGWVNAYSYFSDTSIYPRGFPLEELAASAREPVSRAEISAFHCPIQQGLADRNPDVDAIYRMLLPLPIDFRPDTPIVLKAGSWCPFNSQNTVFFPEVFPLLYLPTFCTFRMTDIWRSFVAQRLLWTCGWHLSFHSSTVWQDRNKHNLLEDFADEVPGYLNNARIGRELDGLDLAPGPAALHDNMRRSYQKLIEMGLILDQELPLLEAWLTDLHAAGTFPSNLSS